MKPPPIHRANTGEQFAFLPTSSFCISWPTKDTLDDKALVMAGTTLDRSKSAGERGLVRLDTVMLNLRALGYPLDSIPALNLREKGHCRSFALYRLPTKYIAQELSGGAHP